MLQSRSDGNATEIAQPVRAVHQRWDGKKLLCEAFGQLRSLELVMHDLQTVF
jgi:hypothetical protein